MFPKYKNISFYLKKYNLKDPWELVNLFEKKIAKYAGSKYAISTDCCTNSIFLCLQYLKKKKLIITIPEKTYVSVMSAIRMSGHKIKLEKKIWQGTYQLKPLRLIDSALRFKRKMYVSKSFMCLSFHHRKHLPIGRGGMILTDNLKAYSWLIKARYDGRNMNKNFTKDIIKNVGWHMYMTPEQATKGLDLLSKISNDNNDLGGSDNYKSLKSLVKIYNKL